MMHMHSDSIGILEQLRMVGEQVVQRKMSCFLGAGKYLVAGFRRNVAL